MRKHLLAGTAALAIIVPLQGPVRAADMPVKAPAPVAPAAFNWSGFYLGGHFGWGSNKFLSTISQPGDDRRSKATVGGLQLGYNLQTGNIVWGIEGDLSAAGFQQSISDNSFHTDLLASIRGRLGIAFDRLLFYGTGGWGYVNGKVQSSEAGDNSLVKFHKTRPVWGGGIEWAATNNLIYRIEFLDYVGKQSIGGEDSGGNKVGDIKVLRVGLSYKFGPDGKAPVPVAGLPVKAQAAPGPFNWSGFYLGGHLGYGSSGFASVDSEPGLDRRAKGAVGGLQMSYAIQTGAIVWGAEADVSAAGLSTAISDNAFKTNLLASIRGTLGIAFDRIQLYGTGGWARVQGKFHSSSQGFSNPFKFHINRPVVGGGIKYAAADNLIYRIEFLDYLKTQNIVDPGDDGNRQRNIWVARFGFDYKFDSSGWGKSPVVAKY